MSPKKAITLSLISHTNIGKTTLARTLLRKDIGIVADQAHVTVENTQHTILTTADGDALYLWDTPGFPNCQKILKRLSGTTNPIVRILAEVWDRFVDRPSWCAQQAIKNVQEDADIILYLINAAEEPTMAGYILSEMQVLAWVGKPIIVLLNQTGRPKPVAEQTRLEDQWERYCQQFSLVKAVHSLDAFSRCWVQEGVLFEKIQALLPIEDRGTMEKLFRLWQKTNLSILHSSMTRLAALLTKAAKARVMTKGDGTGQEPQRQRAVEELLRELKNEVWSATKELIQLHGLEGDAMSTIEARLGDVEVSKVSQQREEAVLGGTAIGGLGGGLVSGAVAGLHMDGATGGFSLGLFTLAGAIVGGVVGAFGGEVWAETKEGSVQVPVYWSHEYLLELVQDAILRYLAIAHFGRGQGQYADDPEHPRFWSEKVRFVLAPHHFTLQNLWRDIRETESSPTLQTPNQLTQLFETIVVELLSSTYPEGKKFLTLDTVYSEEGR